MGTESILMGEVSRVEDELAREWTVEETEEEIEKTIPIEESWSVCSATDPADKRYFALS